MAKVSIPKSAVLAVSTRVKANLLVDPDGISTNAMELARVRLGSRRNAIALNLVVSSRSRRRHASRSFRHPSGAIETGRPALWIHRNAHDSRAYESGRTPIVCTHRGYDEREVEAVFPSKLRSRWPYPFDQEAWAAQSHRSHVLPHERLRRMATRYDASRAQLFARLPTVVCFWSD